MNSKNQTKKYSITKLEKFAPLETTIALPVDSDIIELAHDVEIKFFEDPVSLACVGGDIFRVMRGFDSEKNRLILAAEWHLIAGYNQEFIEFGELYAAFLDLDGDERGELNDKIKDPR